MTTLEEHDVHINRLIAQAQHADPVPVLDALDAIEADPALSDLLRVRYANVRAVALHYSGQTDACRDTVASAIELARTIDALGWVVNFLSYQAEYAIDDDRFEAALVHLIEAESLVLREPDPEIRAVAHTGIGQTLRYARLYELALPHFSQAHAIDLATAEPGTPMLVGYANLVEVNLDWAEEIDRVRDGDPSLERQYRARLDAAAGWCGRALAAATGPMRDDDHTYLPWFRRVQAHLDAIADPAGSLDLLADLLTEFEAGQRTVDVVAVRLALARAQRALGDPTCVDTVRRAHHEVAALRDQNLRVIVAHELHRCLVATGTPAAIENAAYIELLNRTLWQRRLSDVASSRLRTEVAQVREAHEIASAEARVDPLTGLANRRAFEEWCRKHPSASTSLFVVDLDRFKAVNDRHGHGVGDAVLRGVADALRAAVRPGDLVVRHGGDEFIVAMDRISEADATTATVRLLADTVAAVTVDAGGERLRVTASVGAATARSGEHFDDVLAKADAAMFATKRQHRPR